MKISLIILFFLIFFIASASAEEYLVLKWNYSAREMVNGIFVSDFNNDGKKEIAAIASIEGAVYFINSETKNLTWRKSVFCPVYSISGADLDNDGYTEILVGSCTHLHVFDHSGSQKWQFFTDHGAVKVILPVNIDNDENLELLIGAGSPESNIKNNLYFVSKEGKLIWKKRLPSSPSSIDVFDIDYDGLKEIVVGMESVGSGFGVFKGRISAYNENGTLKWEKRLKDGIRSVKVDDIDKDGNYEIIAGSFTIAYALDKNGNITWNYTTGGYVYSIGIANVDKEKFLVIGSNDVFVFDSKLKLKWKYNTGDETYVMKIADLENDKKDEIFVGADKLYLFDAKEGKLLFESNYFSGVKGIFYEDLENDNYMETIIGALDANIYVFETKTYAKKQEAASYLKKAQNFLNYQNYENASLYAEKAKKIYSELKDNTGVKNSENLIAKINNERNKKDEKKKLADLYFNNSKNHFLANNFKFAQINANKAKALYLELGDKTLAEKSDSIINNSIIALKVLAEEYYKNSSLLYEEKKNYSSALNLVREAKAIYKWLNETNVSTKKIDELMGKVYYSLAEDEFKKGKIENATKNVQAALQIFIFLGNETYKKEIEKANELQEKILRGPKKEEFFLGEFITIGIIAILSLILIVWIYFLIKKRKQEYKPKEEVQKIETPIVEEKKPKFPKLEPITKDKFKGVGRSLKV